MKNLGAAFSEWASKIPGQIYLLLGIIIFATSTCLVRRLTEIGAQHLIEGRNPISYLNVLWVGNFCALLFLLGIYHREWSINSLKRLSGRDWLSLATVGILYGAIAPLLVFKALSLTAIANVVLVGRLEPLLVLALSIWFLKERVHILQIIGALIAFSGVILTVVLQEPKLEIFIGVGVGEFLVAVGAIAFAFATFLVKIRLAQTPLGIISVLRAAAGTIVFFCLILLNYDGNQLTNAFSPCLWQCMVICGPIVFGVGQLCWFTGIKRSAASEISLAGCFTPIAGILAAYLILKEVPTFAQYIAGIIILGGFLLSQIGIRQLIAPAPVVIKIEPSHKMAAGLELEGA